MKNINDAKDSFGIADHVMPSTVAMCIISAVGMAISDVTEGVWNARAAMAFAMSAPICFYNMRLMTRYVKPPVGIVVMVYVLFIWSGLTCWGGVVSLARNRSYGAELITILTVVAIAMASIECVLVQIDRRGESES